MQLRTLFAAAALLSASLVARADTADFNFNFTGNHNGSISLSAISTGTAGQYVATGATGTIDGSTITLLAPGTFPTFAPPANDNLFFYAPNPTYLDGAGISFANAAGLYLNLFGDASGYTEDVATDLTGQTIGTASPLTSFNVTGATIVPSAATPEPSSLVLLGTGAIGLAGLVRRRLA